MNNNRIWVRDKSIYKAKIFFVYYVYFESQTTIEIGTTWLNKKIYFYFGKYALLLSHSITIVFAVTTWMPFTIENNLCVYLCMFVSFTIWFLMKYSKPITNNYFFFFFSFGLDVVLFFHHDELCILTWWSMFVYMTFQIWQPMWCAHRTKEGRWTYVAVAK